MFARYIDSLMTPTAVLWLLGSVMAATLLVASANRRKSRLTSALKDFVERHHADSKSKMNETDARNRGERQ